MQKTHVRNHLMKKRISANPEICQEMLYHDAQEDIFHFQRVTNKDKMKYTFQCIKDDVGKKLNISIPMRTMNILVLLFFSYCGCSTKAAKEHKQSNDTIGLKTQEQNRSETTKEYSLSSGNTTLSWMDSETVSLKDTERVDGFTKWCVENYTKQGVDSVRAHNWCGGQVVNDFGYSELRARQRSNDRYCEIYKQSNNNVDCDENGAVEGISLGNIGTTMRDTEQNEMK